jgi:hypothetical protein
LSDHDLGYGVRVRELEDDAVEVCSPELELPWRARQGAFPGTLVRWQGADWEVVARRASDRWRLEGWADEAVVRSQARLDAVTIAALVAVANDQQRRDRLRLLLLGVAPLVGLAPRVWQERLMRELAYPARGAAWLSAWLEVAVGVVLSLDMAVTGLGGQGFLPTLPGWLHGLGVAIGVEGALRLVMLMTSDGPVGSVVSQPLLLLIRQPPSPTTPVRVRADRGDGVLELATAEQRRDWQIDGWLMVRGTPYRLVTERQETSRWLYRFERAIGRGEGVTQLHWSPRSGPEPDGSGRVARSSVVAGLELVAFSFAPADLQIGWARRHGVPAWAPTMLSAAAEVIGGLANLMTRPAGVLTVVDVLLLADGAVRLAGVMVRRSPVGSLLGLPWRGWYQSRLRR